MQRRFFRLSLLGSFAVCGFSQRLFAPTPPENHALREVRPGVKQTDESFDRWIEAMQNGSSPLAMDDAAYKTFLQSQDAYGRALWDLKKGSGELKARADRAVQLIESQNAELAQAPLFPYLAQALLDSGSMSLSQQQTVSRLLNEKGGVSCPRRRSILKSMRDFDRSQIKRDMARKYFAQIKEFRSNSFQEEALRTLIYRLDDESMKSMKKDLVAAIQPYPRLVSAYPEFFEEQAQLVTTSTVRSKTDAADKAARAEDCERSQRELVAAIQDDSGKQYLSLIESSASKLETCWRGKSERNRLAYWQEIEAPLKSRYGFPGESLAQRKQGLILWGRNDFESAKAIFSRLLEQSEKKFPAEHAESLFTFARILQNEGDFEKAEANFEKFVELYPQDPKVNEALGEIIIIASIRNRSEDAVAAAMNLVDREYRKHPNDRDTGVLPMALYWLGKLAYEKEDRKKAEFFWSRLAQEFYSTFYGAMGQLALEKLSGKNYYLPPIQVPDFKLAEMYKDFSQADRLILRRAEALLASGQKADAACEISEIPAGDDHRTLAKAIFQFASGDFLAAVKSYQNLSKAYRIALPKGMERLLFPISYGELVEGYAKKLGVDPHFANGIIRQESVFNPKAQSPVGARGLMQMMPATARMEARSLPAHYVERGKSGLVSAALSDERNLSDPETNVMLGVHHVNRLMSKYKHPVFVLTSYNANPRATERWQSNIDTSDMILFVERIPYKETRSYVKLVMRNYFYYKRWYSGPTAELPLMDGLLPPKLVEEARERGKVQTSMR